MQPEYFELPMIKDQSVVDSATGVTDVYDTLGYSQKTVYVKTDYEITVKVKGGILEDEIGYLKTGDTGGGSQAENAELIWTGNGLFCFPIMAHLRYMQVEITNNSGSTATVSVWLGGR